ncbi:MAG: F0F1 ATP synthase subunit A [Candidatus Margulisbacteria bacterium]|nr:F0F1 ATP synthase subunit A [Candidatus Margulisiibacteriota bacterium]
MDEIGKVTLSTITLLGREITFNPNMIIMTWVVMGILIALSFFAARGLKSVPGKLQNMFEIVIEFLDDITVSTLGKKDGQKFLPLIATIFLFILLSNWIGILPNICRIFGSFIALGHGLLGTPDAKIVFEGITAINILSSPDNWYSFLFNVPPFEEPTKFVSTCLALGILVFFVVHTYGIKNKGIVQYFKDYMDPVPAKAPYIYFFWLNPFFYLAVIGNLSNVVSHSFRLFGNIFGGGMIIVIVSSLLKHVLIPVGLFAFFGLFAGLVQAFVFTMLSVTYIAQQR